MTEQVIAAASGLDGKSEQQTAQFAAARKDKYRQDKLFKRLRRKTGHAVCEYRMIERGDRILVCMSGGKDSYALLELLLSLQRSAPIPFELIAVHINPGFPDSAEQLLEGYLKERGVTYHILNKPVFELCREKLPEGKPWCSLCARLRLGFLYGAAQELGANKLALGHHKDDVLCTLLLNLFHSGILKTMPPVYRTDDYDLCVIRPLVYCRERDLAALAEVRGFPLLPKGLCGFGEDQERAAMKVLLKSFEARDPKCGDIMFRALSNVIPSHLFDRKLYDFQNFRNIVYDPKAPGPDGSRVHFWEYQGEDEGEK